MMKLVEKSQPSSNWGS